MVTFRRGIGVRARTLMVVVLTAALLPAIANPDAAHADGTGMIISEIPNGSISAAIPGIVMPGNIIVSPDGTTNPGNCTVSGPGSPEGCLVIGSTAVTSPVRVSDGFELMGPPGPAEWDPIARSAEATIANLRGVAADTHNQYWARAEINSLTLVKLFELISRKADGERLTYDENRALKRLSDAYRNYEIAAADKALDFYTLWKNNPCGFRVPVGDTPDSYRKLLGTACGSRVFSLVTHIPAPSPDLFTGWGREHSQSEDVYAPLARSMQNYNRDLGPEEAKAEVKREYQELVGSLQAGMAFLAAEREGVVNLPDDEQPDSAGELLESWREVVDEIGQDQVMGMAEEILTTLVTPLLPYWLKQELGLVAKAAPTLQGAGNAAAAQVAVKALGAVLKKSLTVEAAIDWMAETGLFIGGVIIGAAAVITAESIKLVQDESVGPTLRARRETAGNQPDLNALLHSNTGRQKLIHAFTNELLPQFSARKNEEPAPVGSPPDDFASSRFRVWAQAAGVGSAVEQQYITVHDWARPRQAQRVGASSGWVSRAARVGIKDGVDIWDNPKWETSFNYVDEAGDHWQAWPVRGRLLHVRRAKAVRGHMTAYAELRHGIGAATIDGVSVPCHSQNWGIGGSEGSIEVEFLGYGCVVGSSAARFTQDLEVGDYIKVNAELKRVAHIYSDRVLRVDTPFESDGKTTPRFAFAGRSASKQVRVTDSCWDTGDCRFDDHFAYRRPVGADVVDETIEDADVIIPHDMMEAEWGNGPPVVSPTFAGTLRSVAGLPLPQECDAHGNCRTPVVDDWSFAAFEPVTIQSNAFDGDPGDSVVTQEAQACESAPTYTCHPLTETSPGKWIYSFPANGRWIVVIEATDSTGAKTTETAVLNLRKFTQEITDLGATSTEAVAGTGTVLTPVASSGLPVAVSTTTPAYCTTGGDHGTTVSFTKAGKCVLAYSQPGDGVYAAAPGRTATFTIKKAASSVTVTPNETTAGQAATLRFGVTVEPGTTISSPAAFKMTVPKGWTAPQLATPVAPGHVSIEAASVQQCSSVALTSVTGSGPWTVQGSATGCDASVNAARWNVLYTSASTTNASGKDPKAVVGDPYVFPMTLQTKTGVLALNNDPATGATLDRTGGWGRVWVRGAAAAKLHIGIESKVDASTGVPITVSWLDQYGNIAPQDPPLTGLNARSAISLTPSTGGSILVPIPLRSRTYPTKIPLQKAGPATITIACAQAACFANPLYTGSASTNVVAGPVADLELVSTSMLTAGTPAQYTVTTIDAFGNKATPGYRGTVRFASTDPQAVLPADYTFTAADAGKHTFPVTHATAGWGQVISVTDITSQPAGMDGTSSRYVFPGVLTSLTLTPPDHATAGDPATFKVSAFDAFGNPIVNKWTPVSFTSNDPLATLPGGFRPEPALQYEGTGSFPVTLRTPGTRTVTVKALGGTVWREATASTTVITGNPATSFEVTSGVAAAGEKKRITVTALDASGNRTRSFTGAVTLTSSDARFAFNSTAHAPEFTPADDGQVSWDASFGTAGAQSVTARSVANPSLFGVGMFNVTPGPATHVRASLSATSVEAGTEATVLLKVVDKYGNTATNFTGGVRILTTDPQASYTSDHSFALGDAGQKSVPVTWKTAGIQTLSYGAPGLNATPVKVTVTPALPETIVVNGGTTPTEAVVNKTTNLTVQMRDAFGNVVPNTLSGTTRFAAFTYTASNPQPTFVAQTQAGADTALRKVKFPSKGTWTIAVDGTFRDRANQVQHLTGTAEYVVRNPAATSLDLSGPTDATEGPQNFTVTIRDENGAVSTGYRGVVRFTSNRPGITLPADYLFKGGADAGSRMFTITLPAGATTLTATETGPVPLTDSHTVTVPDAVDPVITIDGVTDGGTYLGTVTPTIDVTDNVGVDLAVARRVHNAVDWPFTSGTAVTDPGVHVLRVIARDAAGNQAEAEIEFTVLPWTDDHFAGATQLTGASGSIAGSNVDATAEPGEPAAWAGGPHHSRWYAWTAPSNSTVTFETCDATDFDTVLAAYSGSTLDDLTQLAQGDEECESQSRISFVATAGETYHIQVDGWSAGDDGSFTLTWSSVLPPANDAFTAAESISGESGYVVGTTVGATAEGDEPGAVVGGAARTVWYDWEAPSDGVVRFNTCWDIVEGHDTVLAAYTGSAFPLQQAGSGDNGCFEAGIAPPFNQPSPTLSVMEVAVEQGQHYRIQVDAKTTTTGSFGLAWSMLASNDSFNEARGIGGASGNVAGTTRGATSEEDEPATCAGGPGSGCVGVTDGPNATVWYAWQAPGDGPALFSTCSNSSFDSMLAAYDDHPAFGGVRVAESNFGGCGALQFDAVGGQTYWIQVDARNGATGTFRLSYQWETANDDFADAIELPGTSGTRGGSMEGATAEAGEPFPCDGGTGCTFITDLPDTTVWYRWTAPANGTAVFDTCLSSSASDTVVALYTGSTLTALDRKGQNDNGCNPRSRVTIPVTAGETYRIQVDGVVNTPVAFVLRWAFTAS